MLFTLIKKIQDLKHVLDSYPVVSEFLEISLDGFETPTAINWNRPLIWSEAESDLVEIETSI